MHVMNVSIQSPKLMEEGVTDKEPSIMHKHSHYNPWPDAERVEVQYSPRNEARPGTGYGVIQRDVRQSDGKDVVGRMLCKWLGAGDVSADDAMSLQPEAK